PLCVVGAGAVELDAHHFAARQLGDVEPAALAERHVVRARPVAGDGFLQRGGIARGQTVVRPLIAGRRRGLLSLPCSRLRLLLTIRDLLEALFAQALLT